MISLTEKYRKFFSFSLIKEKYPSKKYNAFELFYPFKTVEGKILCKYALENITTHLVESSLKSRMDLQNSLVEEDEGDLFK